MKVVTINGQNHKGSTYQIGKKVADKLGGELTEFFLPKDFGEFCVGCSTCFMKTETKCPHYEKLKNITEAMDLADVIILTSPVYVYHVTGSMKAFLDHYGYRWMVHRPEEKMFSKQAVCISTAAGAGMKSTNKDMKDSLFFWGIPKIYKYGVAVRAISYDEISEKTLNNIEKNTTSLAKKIQKRNGKVRIGIKTRTFFFMMHLVQKKGWNAADKEYWDKKEWNQKNRPWKR